MRALVGLAVGCLAAVALPAAAEAEEEKICEPACGAGATCVNGLCMVPAQSAPPAVTPAPAPTPPPAQGTGYPGYPPPAYYYPPPNAYPPPAAAATARPERSGFLALPYIGLHSFSGQGTGSLDPGLRLGTLLGGSVSDIFSANGEITVDILNPSASGVDVSEEMATLTFSPLFHARSAAAEFVIGPKIGIWALTGHASDGIQSYDISQNGWTVGGNVGAFFPVGGGSASLGMLVSYANLQVSETCVTMNGYPEDCSLQATSDANVFGLTFAALF